MWILDALLYLYVCDSAVSSYLPGEYSAIQSNDAEQHENAINFAQHLMNPKEKYLADDTAGSLREMSPVVIDKTIKTIVIDSDGAENNPKADYLKFAMLPRKVVHTIKTEYYLRKPSDPLPLDNLKQFKYPTGYFRSPDINSYKQIHSNNRLVPVTHNTDVRQFKKINIPKNEEDTGVVIKKIFTSDKPHSSDKFKSNKGSSLNLNCEPERENKNSELVSSDGSKKVLSSQEWKKEEVTVQDKKKEVNSVEIRKQSMYDSAKSIRFDSTINPDALLEEIAMDTNGFLMPFIKGDVVNLQKYKFIASDNHLSKDDDDAKYVTKKKYKIYDRIMMPAGEKINGHLFLNSKNGYNEISPDHQESTTNSLLDNSLSEHLLQLELTNKASIETTSNGVQFHRAYEWTTPKQKRPKIEVRNNIDYNLKHPPTVIDRKEDLETDPLKIRMHFRSSHISKKPQIHHKVTESVPDFVEYVRRRKTIDPDLPITVEEVRVLSRKRRGIDADVTRKRISLSNFIDQKRLFSAMPYDGCCYNGGTCFSPNRPNDKTKHRWCICPPNFSGRFCELDVNECLNGTICKEHEVCINMVGGFNCTCAPGFVKMANDCIPTVTCEEMPCMSGAVCIDTENGSFKCICPLGFLGHICDIRVPECEDSSCSKDEVCVSMETGYRCLKKEDLQD